ncbi:DNA topoisomerase IB [Puia sp.]|jgi:DNA topoisomerase-1|uniref:DNA topoisomerase IB n=1 Tax=Puia sp. TaxID=2045100 RepID=UPI002F3FAA91
MAAPIPPVSLSHKQFLRVDHDHEQAAEAASLVYVTDRSPGITRTKHGKGYTYALQGKTITDKTVIQRIRGLVIPPSWTAVWICPIPTGHIQATGLDLRRRKQYRYHALWNTLRNETKFHRLYEFAKALPTIREKIEADLRRKELTREKVLATVLSLMEKTYIRVGNNEYEKANGSYGLTTLRNKHVSLSGDRIAFSFTGKKGVKHNITLKNKRLARTLGQCREIPGRELFQYYDEAGNHHSIDSGMINHYIKEAAGMDFTAKDFRTWAGSLHALQQLKAIGEAATVAECRKNVAGVLDAVSKELGNSRAVCKKYYVHPGLLRLYEENSLIKYIGENNSDDDEQTLTRILKNYISTPALVTSPSSSAT